MTTKKPLKKAFGYGGETAQKAATTPTLKQALAKIDQAAQKKAK